VTVVRGDAGRVSVSPRYLVFDGASGALLQVKDRSGAAAETRGVLYGLHVGRFADAATRWLYFFASLTGAAMVATGLVLWTSKRRARQAAMQRAPFGLRLVERLNVAAIAGLPVAMAAFLWGNRLLPIGLAARSEWEVHLFFIAWGLMLLHACARRTRRAWAEQFAAAAVLLATLPLAGALRPAHDPSRAGRRVRVVRTHARGAGRGLRGGCREARTPAAKTAKAVTAVTAVTAITPPGLQLTM
jgi:uncharacterized iron-regulated membrane protein